MLDHFDDLQELFEQAIKVPGEQRGDWCRARSDIDSGVREQLMQLLSRDQQLRNASSPQAGEVDVPPLERATNAKKTPARRVRRLQAREDVGHVGMYRVFQAIHVELDRLESLNRDSARIVVLRMFAGLSIKETAEVCGTSMARVGRQWRFARAWLTERLDPKAGARDA